ncbi:DNA-binding domain-containing protein [Aphanizomenon sp. UHCC 0183]|uniref:DNA-binding domain-containing protein n=1 Tax=Aphanizomenon sp. UHCC 0183 TaxID=2590028 RepID=UPI0014461E79|nr:DNA-binding domain-containing protein [Aphanizomenon sp. UHCC 0183]MTJ29046.1 DNA-binding domain-containing protein [Aphanizomenon sp. UHCC 0183]
MGKPQIAIRLSPSLLQELNNYVELTGTSKTDVVVSAISQYIGCTDNMPLNQRMGELEKRLRELESKFDERCFYG